jgi:predicted nuclease of predicted toxin-antitoxin system
MRVLLDENLDRRLKEHFRSEHVVKTVSECGWSGKKNGELLRAAELEFDVLVTMDQGLRHQQNLSGRDISIILIAAHSNRRQDVAPAMEAVNRALETIVPGEFVGVDARGSR